MLPLGDSFCNSNQHLRVKGITPLKIAHKRHREVTADAGLPSARNVILHMQEILNMDAIDRLFGEGKKKSLNRFFSESFIRSWVFFSRVHSQLELKTTT